MFFFFRRNRMRLKWGNEGLEVEVESCESLDRVSRQVRYVFNKIQQGIKKVEQEEKGYS